MAQRHLIARVRASLGEFPAVLLIGARQAGKSTLAQALVDAGALDEVVTLDDMIHLDAARADPEGFLARRTGSVAIDEIQRVPDLMRALKRTIDKDRRPGRFLLTGSANVLALPSVTESLAGRVDIVRLEGLSLAEIEGRPDRSDLLERLLEEPIRDLVPELKKAAHKRRLEQDELREHVFFGGFPGLTLRRKVAFATRWHASYLTAYIERDVRDLTRLPDTTGFHRLCRLAQLRTGNLLNAKNLGHDAGLDQRTAARYLDLMESTFQLVRLPPWFANVGKRLVKSPKVYACDSGLACHLAGVRAPEELDRHPGAGALLETWVFAELRKLISLHVGIESTFYRAYDGHEVDFVLERGRHRLGIEVKSTHTVTQGDLRGLRDFGKLAGKEFRGLVLHAGTETAPLDDRIVATPLTALL